MNRTQDGFLVVASRRRNFYLYALNLLESLRDYYPAARTCLVTERRFCDGREDLADHVIHCGDDYRAKLWGMAQSPFAKTFYMDADSEVVHEDIATVFGYLQDHDLVLTRMLPEADYCYRIRKFPGGAFQYSSGVCLYDSRKPLVRRFMMDWHGLFNRQYHDEWWPAKEDGSWDEERYPRDQLKWWDQFTLWWLLNKVEAYQTLKVGLFDNDARWNYFNRYQRRFNHNHDKPIVILHYSGGIHKDDDLVAPDAGEAGGSDSSLSMP